MGITLLAAGHGHDVDRWAKLGELFLDERGGCVDTDPENRSGSPVEFLVDNPHGSERLTRVEAFPSRNTIQRARRGRSRRLPAPTINSTARSTSESTA